MVANKVFEVVLHKNLPAGTKIINSIWVIKKKNNGTLCGWMNARVLAHVVDVKGAFLHGEFEDGEIIHMKIPQGFEKHFPEGSVLLFLKCLYGLKQAAKAFWRQLLCTAKGKHGRSSETDSKVILMGHEIVKL